MAKSGPEMVTRLATRYINHMQIPLPIADFTAYLTAAPNIPSNLPQAISSFFSKVVMQYMDIDAAASVVQALEPSINPNFITIIFDIDVYIEKDFSVDSANIWSNLEKLRNVKNEIFFSYITEKTARLFE